MIPKKKKHFCDAGKNKKKSERSGDIILSKDENSSQQNLKVVSGEYKLPLVWIDLEMTGS